jgi:hypothetical protein
VRGRDPLEPGWPEWVDALDNSAQTGEGSMVRGNPAACDRQDVSPARSLGLLVADSDSAPLEIASETSSQKQKLLTRAE